MSSPISGRAKEAGGAERGGQAWFDTSPGPSEHGNDDMQWMLRCPGHHAWDDTEVLPTGAPVCGKLLPEIMIHVHARSLGLGQNLKRIFNAHFPSVFAFALPLP